MSKPKFKAYRSKYKGQKCVIVEHIETGYQAVLKGDKPGGGALKKQIKTFGQILVNVYG